MKKILACIFLAVFTLQVLPVKELGKILYKGLMTEEIHEVEAEGKTGDAGSFKWKKQNNEYSLDVSTAHQRAVYLTSMAHLAIVHAENLPERYVPDIPTPPPNFS